MVVTGTHSVSFAKKTGILLKRKFGLDLLTLQENKWHFWRLRPACQIVLELNFKTRGCSAKKFKIRDLFWILKIKNRPWQVAHTIWLQRMFGIGVAPLGICPLKMSTNYFVDTILKELHSGRIRNAVPNSLIYNFPSIIEAKRRLNCQDL